MSKLSPDWFGVSERVTLSVGRSLVVDYEVKQSN